MTARATYVGPVARWDVFLAELDYAMGQEEKKTRPVIIVSTEAYNVQRAFTAYAVVPCTKLEGKRRKVYPWEVVLPKGTIPALKPGDPIWTSIVMPQQIRTLDRMRFIRKLTTITDPAQQIAIEDAIAIHLDL